MSSMTIDERIEALTAKQEALTQSVELLAQMHQDNEREYKEMFARIVEVQETLVRVVGNHDSRLRRLEGQ